MNVNGEAVRGGVRGESKPEMGEEVMRISIEKGEDERRKWACETRSGRAKGATCVALVDL